MPTPHEERLGSHWKFLTPTLLEILFYLGRHAGRERHQSGLIELGHADPEHRLRALDVFYPQMQKFAAPQPATEQQQQAQADGLRAQRIGWRGRKLTGGVQ